MHNFLIYLSIYFCLTYFRLSFSPSSEAGVHLRQWFNSREYGVSDRALTPCALRWPLYNLIPTHLWSYMMRVLYVRKADCDYVWTFSGKASETIWISSAITADFRLGFKPNTLEIKFVALPFVSWLAYAVDAGRMTTPIGMNLRWQWNCYIVWERQRILSHCSEPAGGK
jgi:hypothetical protein